MTIKQTIKRIYQFIRFGIPTIEHKHIYAQISALPPNELLKDRIILITGGTSGIGLEMAKSCLRAQATVIITGRSEERLKAAFTKIIEAIDTAERLFCYPMDNTNVAEIEHCIPTMLSRFHLDRIDTLINNAGINKGPKDGTLEEKFDAIIDTNLKGSYFMARTFAEYLRCNEIQGNILNIASSSSERPATEPYTLSKWGIKGLTKGLARVYTQYGIVVNGIAPGPTATPMMNKEGGSVEDLVLNTSLAGRLVTPEEVANMAVILISNMSRMVIGDIVYMTGGAGNIYNEDLTYHF